MSLRTADYDYELPDELIARYPAPRREDARMMALDRAARTIDHRVFREFPSFLRPGDLVVLNDTKVTPTRVFTDGGRIELLVVERRSPEVWKCLVRPGRKARPGAVFCVDGIPGRVVEVIPGGERLIAFERPPDLGRIGHVPLPPYLRRPDEPADRERYQTVFARSPGAIAAPTAGLHFTPEILRAIPHVFLTLHVGPGTFRPVEADDLTAHPMHGEWFEISGPAAEAINAADRVVAVGTTTVRALETMACARGRVRAGSGVSTLFIHPPRELLVAGAILTNFHLPRSTLLMLVSAFAGRDFVLEAYRQAVAGHYRFFSYGDCMLIE